MVDRGRHLRGLGHRAMVRKLTVNRCVCVHKPGPLLGAAAGNGVRGTAAAWAT